MAQHQAPPHQVVIGIDVGTTAAKVTAFGVGTPFRTTVEREYPLLRPRPGWAVQEVPTVLAAVAAALAECVHRVAGSHVACLSVSTAMHGLVGLDDELRPLTPLATWADGRAAEQSARLATQGVARELHERSGTPVHPFAPLSKLLWFAQEEPELFGRVRAWAGLKDVVLHHLTGTLVTELSSASGTGLLDLRTRQWSPDTLELVRVRQDQLPEVLDTTAALGLTRRVAERLGLPVATPVVVGAGDGPLGNLGTGALEPGVAGLSIGTSAALRQIVPEPRIDPEGRLFCYALTRDAWAVGGALTTGGSVVRWAGDVFGRDLMESPGESVDADLLALARSVPPGSEGLAMVPWLGAERAPLWNPTVRGAFVGLRASHTRGHFVRAAVEGVALQVEAVLRQVESIHPVHEIRATGGVFRSDLWRDVLSAVLNRPLVVAAGAEGSGLGAAALGAWATGLADDLPGALQLLADEDTLTGDEEVIRPDPERVAQYDRLTDSVADTLETLGRAAEVLRSS